MRHRYRTKIFCQIMFIIMTEKNGDCDYKKSEEQKMQIAKIIYDIEEYYNWYGSASGQECRRRSCYNVIMIRIVYENFMYLLYSVRRCVTITKANSYSNRHP